MNRITASLAFACALCAWAVAVPCAVADDAQTVGPAKFWHTPLVIAAADFRNDGNNLEGYVFEPDGYLRGAGSPATMFAPVYLPDGATVTQLTAFVYDNNDDCGQPDITVTMRRTRLDSGVAETMASAATVGINASPQSIIDSTIDNPTVDNANYSYYVHATLCSAMHELTALTITYGE